jgi:hypothetical protein
MRGDSGRSGRCIIKALVQAAPEKKVATLAFPEISCGTGLNMGAARMGGEISPMKTYRESLSKNETET